jgi:hypothetical protein
LNFYRPLLAQVSNVVISILVACTPVDSHATLLAGDIYKAYMPDPMAPSALQRLSHMAGNATDALAAVGTFWNYDTALKCWEGDLKAVFVMGVIWAVAFCGGFPIILAVVLVYNRHRLRTTMVRGARHAPRSLKHVNLILMVVSSNLACPVRCCVCTCRIVDVCRQDEHLLLPHSLTQVDLQFGFFYNSYRWGWHSITQPPTYLYVGGHKLLV